MYLLSINNFSGGLTPLFLVFIFLIMNYRFSLLEIWNYLKNTNRKAHS